ncbi:TIGR04282 family arsenosugar biosynthesis glycosyltransferase [Candidatus Spongiihabitans sp.]|uniref:TIGR04282 family arsenosugar biosynthesis glycosyltransferase n=1 Tax=Candidatus Spongiihabitans sp. TaxID=3101308 RepID=UPI003C79979D
MTMIAQMIARAQLPLYLFAKAPIPGLVKTRMHPHLSDIQSARLATLMLEQSIDKVCRFWPGKLMLTVSPSIHDPLFQNFARNNDLDLEAQISGDLGERMTHVMHKGIEQFGSAVVMGCDVPQITHEILVQVHRLLAAKNNVIGPASDGGFYLLGLSQIAAGVFEGVDWGGSQVLSQVCGNFQRLGIALSRCAELRDIDNWDDLCWLGAQDQRYQGFVT